MRRSSAVESREVQCHPIVRHVLKECHSVEIDQVKFTIAVKDEIGLLQIPVRETFVVQLRDESGRVPNQFGFRLSALAKVVREIHCAVDFLHQEVASKEETTQPTLRRRDGARRRNAGQFEMVRFAKRTPGAGGPEQVLEEILQLPEVESLQHQSIRLAHSRSASRFQYGRPRLQEFVRPVQHPADGVVHERKAHLPFQAAVSLLRELAVVQQTASRTLLQQLLAKLPALFVNLARQRNRQKDPEEREVLLSLFRAGVPEDACAVEINESQLERFRPHQQVPRMEIFLQHAAFVHLPDEFEHCRQINIHRRRQRHAIESFGDQDAFLHAAPGPALAERDVPDDGDAPRFELLRQLPLLPGLRGFKEKFQRAKRDGMMEVALDVEPFFTELMAGDAFDRGFLHCLTWRFQQFIEERREVGLEFPADAVVLSLNHAADFGGGTFDCQRAAGSPMIPRVLIFAKSPLLHAMERRALPGRSESAALMPSNARRSVFMASNGVQR